MKLTKRFKSSLAAGLLSFAFAGVAQATDDIKAILEILLDKGIITQQEFDSKIKRMQSADAAKQTSAAPASVTAASAPPASTALQVTQAGADADKRIDDDRKQRVQVYGQLSTGWYQASNMTSANKQASGMSDQPKGNNRVGLRAFRELDNDLTATITLESNFSARTGAVGRDSAGYGQANNAAPGVAFLDREANLRLISKTYGTAILGRGPNLQNDLSGAFDARQNWNFGGLKPIARYVGFHSASGINRADRLLRYISPTFDGFSLDLGKSFGGVPGNDEQASSVYAGARYKNGSFEAGYNHADIKLSAAGATTQTTVNNRVDFLAAKYGFDSVTVNAGYVMNRNSSLASGGAFDPVRTSGKVSANTWFTGAVYRFTPAISANLAYYNVADKTVQTADNKNNGLHMWAGGLMYSPFKDWDFFIDYVAAKRQDGATGAFTIYDKWAPDTGVACSGTANVGCSESKRSQTGTSLGAQYKF